LVIADSSHAPDRGDRVKIRKATYAVIGRTYTADHSDEPRERRVACVINLKNARG